MAGQRGAPQTLLEPGFLPWLGQVLEELRLPRNWLELEITEHALVASSGPLQDVLAGLKALGVGTFLDDFGAGFSALGLLPQLPIRGIKCDRSLLQGTGAEPNRLVITWRRSASWPWPWTWRPPSKASRPSTTLERVRACGAASGQGYFLARPKPAQEVPAWLASDAGSRGTRGGARTAPAPLAST